MTLEQFLNRHSNCKLIAKADRVLIKRNLEGYDKEGLAQDIEDIGYEHIGSSTKRCNLLFYAKKVPAPIEKLITNKDNGERSFLVAIRGRLIPLEPIDLSKAPIPSPYVIPGIVNPIELDEGVETIRSITE